MSHHTPGPWRDDIPSGKILAPDGLVLAEVFDNPNADADSRLIAAAPELLEALKELVEWAMDAATELDIPTHSPSCISKARAAIAKAEGHARPEKL